MTLPHRLPVFAAALACSLLAEHGTGELRLTIQDPAGLKLPAAVELRGVSNNLTLTGETSSDGRYIGRDLPFGLYTLRIVHSGFAPYAMAIEIRSESPLEKTVTLGVAPVESEVDVNDAALLDPGRTAPAFLITRRDVAERTASAPARAVPDLIEAEPGWLLEANSVLHPRGSEYQTQFVVDGIPVTENRSPAFSPSMDVNEIRSMNVLTAGFPAEYGRKLGGVVEVDTISPSRPGWHGEADLGGGSFAGVDGSASAEYNRRGNSLLVSLNGGTTARYLDPPVQANYTNTATYSGGLARFEHDFNDADRLRLTLRNGRSRFEVPDEQVQEDAGQRQDRTGAENAGDALWEHVVSAQVLTSVRVMARDVSAALWSNARATPIEAFQNRGFGEEYAAGSLAAHAGAHELKFGVEAVFTELRETFSYRIADPAFFDPGTPPAFAFAGRHGGQEYGAFAQDLIHAGNWTISAGLRFDSYRLLVADSAFSPRLGAGWTWPAAGLVLRASYDRAFQTPAVENLLLASSASAQRLTSATTGLPVRPSRGNFFQAGFGKSLIGRLRLDANWYRRSESQFADDDTFLNTGVSFPIAFARARIQGFEAKLELPQWGAFSGFVSWSNMNGLGWLPVTGGLFLDAGSAALLHENSSFPISQDQRNTIRARMRWQATKRLWTALAWSYGSGLPIELNEQLDYADLVARYGSGIISRIDLARGRVRPSASLDFSAGAVLARTDRYTARLQANVLNLTGRLNVINFASIFSGTALAPPRSVNLRLTIDY